MTALLVAAGADLNARDETGLSAIELTDVDYIAAILLAGGALVPARVRYDVAAVQSKLTDAHESISAHRAALQTNE